MDGAGTSDEAPRRFIDDYLSYLLARASHLVSRQFHAQLKPRGVAVPVDAQWHLDLDAISAPDADRALLLWLNEPGNPASQSCDESYFERVAEWARAPHFRSPNGAKATSGITARGRRPGFRKSPGYTAVRPPSTGPNGRGRRFC